MLNEKYKKKMFSLPNIYKYICISLYIIEQLISNHLLISLLPLIG